MIATLQNQPGPWTFPFITEYWDGRSGITVAGQGVSTWAPVKGTHSFTQGTDGARPTYSGGVLTFNGTDEMMTTGAFTLNQPVTVFFIGRQITWASNDDLWDGVSANDSCSIIQFDASPELFQYGGAGAGTIADAALGERVILSAVYNGAGSSFRKNLGTAQTGDVGAGNPGGFVIGSRSDAAGCCNCAYEGFAYSSSALTDDQIEQMVRAMAAQYGIAV